MHHHTASLGAAIRVAALLGAALPVPIFAQTALPAAPSRPVPPATTAPDGKQEKDATITVTGSRDGVQTSIDATSYSLAKNL